MVLKIYRLDVVAENFAFTVIAALLAAAAVAGTAGIQPLWFASLNPLDFVGRYSRKKIG